MKNPEYISKCFSTETTGQMLSVCQTPRIKQVTTLCKSSRAAAALSTMLYTGKPDVLADTDYSKKAPWY